MISIPGTAYALSKLKLTRPSLIAVRPHIHMIVPAGGLSTDEMEWISATGKFLRPVKALSGIFRGILCRLSGQAVAKNEIALPIDVENFDQLKNLIYTKQWVVFAKKPFAGPERVIEYLGRYTHRVAITNSRIIANENGKITFRYKDYKSGGIGRKISLGAPAFIDRFFRHILPCGSYKIRYFGIMMSDINMKSIHFKPKSSRFTKFCQMQDKGCP